MPDAPQEFRPRLAQPSELSRKLPSTLAYVDQIGSVFALMVWRHNPDLVHAAGTGQYIVKSVHASSYEASVALDNLRAIGKA